MLMRFSLCFLVLCSSVNNVKTQNNISSCGSDTFWDSTSNSCLCNSNYSDNPNEIYITGIFDLTSYDWGYDIFKVTVDLINQGWWNAIQENQIVEFDLANSDCSDIKAVQSYWSLRERPMHGIIGARCSGASTALAMVSGLEHVPHLSPASNSARLSDDAKFPYFSRLVAPNNEFGEVGGLVTLLRHFGWERVTILATNTVFAKDFVTEFRKEWVGRHRDGSGSWLGSIAYSDTIRLLPDDQVDVESVHQALDGVPTDDSRIVVLVAHSQHAFDIIQQAINEEFQPDTIWVGPSAWVGRTTPDFDFGQLPAPSGYLGVAPYRNRDETYQEFLVQLQNYERQHGKNETTELPPFAAEFVDSIRAMVTAISAAKDMRDGDAVVKILRQLKFSGVSGFVEFTEQGDRKNPKYSVFNGLGFTVDGPVWNDVGSVGTQVGSGDFNLTDICFPQIGCNLKEPPGDTYPVPRPALPLWMVALVVILPLLLVSVAIKYFLSRRSKTRLKAEVKAFRKSVLGMRAVAVGHNYIPRIGKDGDVEQAFAGAIGVAPNACPQWCWQETTEMTCEHIPDDVLFGNWIKYEQTSNQKLERAFLSGLTECSPLSGYKVDLKSMIQTNLSTGFQRKVQRVLKNAVALDSNGGLDGVDLGTIRLGNALPEELDGEPQMVLVKGDIVQISKERTDGWVFGSKLHHADEAVARQLVGIASLRKELEPSEDASVLVDTGWFPRNVTHEPLAKELVELQKKFSNDGLERPPHWDAANPTAVRKVEIRNGDEEYRAVVDDFISTLRKPSFKKEVKIVKVERIQNLAMYQSYIVKRQTICYRETGGDTDEEVQRKARSRFEKRWLWHGCPHVVVDKILQQGFNRSFCGKHATGYGKGVYFARDASYSVDPHYSEPAENGNQHIMACRVVVGEYCRGKHDALIPDIRDPTSQLLYDSTVGIESDSMSNPSVYVTYHDAQAYPEYLITIKVAGNVTTI